MFLTHFSVKHIKCFEENTLTFSPHPDDYSGWNVILGANGPGKRTLL